MWSYRRDGSSYQRETVNTASKVYFVAWECVLCYRDLVKHDTQPLEYVVVQDELLCMVSPEDITQKDFYWDFILRLDQT